MSWRERYARVRLPARAHHRTMRTPCCTRPRQSTARCMRPRSMPVCRRWFTRRRVERRHVLKRSTARSGARSTCWTRSLTATHLQCDEVMPGFLSGMIAVGSGGVRKATISEKAPQADAEVNGQRARIRPRRDAARGCASEETKTRLITSPRTPSAPPSSPVKSI